MKHGPKPFTRLSADERADYALRMVKAIPLRIRAAPEDTYNHALNINKASDADKDSSEYMLCWLRLLLIARQRLAESA
jgi:hypothetical protein